MEVPGGKYNKVWVLTGEATAVCFLMLSVNLGTMAHATALAVSLTVFVMVQVFGGITVENGS